VDRLPTLPAVDLFRPGIGTPVTLDVSVANVHNMFV